MNDSVKIELVPSNKVLRVPAGTPLQDLLFVHGVEFPCGGRGKCKGCRIKVVAGLLPVSSEDSHRLGPEEIAQGWRLACRAAAETDLTIELAQWEAAILSDESAFAFTPQKGWGIAVDLGTTTIVAQLLDLETGQVLGVRTALNLQAKHGADVMSRVEFAVAAKGAGKLKDVVREQIGELAGGLFNEAKSGFEKTRREFPKSLQSVVIVGNSVMHHLFCGIDLEPLSHVPFEPQHPGLQTFTASELGWKWAGSATVHFLPCLGGFVGSDILAGILATNLHRQESVSALMDLGTNGEIVVGNRDFLFCASTAAGPAFEGARISMGMRAATGAISEVHLEEGKVRCHVLGNAAPWGICGSGLVDAVAVGLDLGRIQPGGKLTDGSSLPLTGPISLSQQDIRELQLAKGAIAAGLRILLQRGGASVEAVSRIYLAGAFGNYINYSSAKRIGLLNIGQERVVAAGNTALLGAKMALFKLGHERGDYSEILHKVTHVSLNEDPQFQEVFVQEMGFPSLPLVC